MRDLLRSSLGRSLRTLSEEDRLAAAWPVACGPVLAARAQVLGLDADGVLHVRVVQSGWREQFMQMRTMLVDDLRRIAGVRVRTIHFEGQGARDRAREDASARAAHEPPPTSAAKRKLLEKRP